MGYIRFKKKKKGLKAYVQKNGELNSSILCVSEAYFKILNLLPTFGTMVSSIEAFTLSSNHVSMVEFQSRPEGGKGQIVPSYKKLSTKGGHV